MRRLGIYTFWSIPNYGAYLQAYAMQKSLAEKYTDDCVQQIAHIDKLHFNKYYGYVDFQYKLWMINPKFYSNLLRKISKRKEIKGLRSFQKYYDIIPHTGKYTKQQLKKEKFDVVVLGSDIIWDYSQRIFNNDEMLFGNGFNAEKVVSYAASFGTVKPGMMHPEYVKNGIEKMNFISVRDENSSEVVNEIIGKKPLVVCDPTFLWDFTKDSNVVVPDIQDEYIIVYGSYFKDEYIKEIKAYAQKNSLKIICLNSLNDSFEWCDENINQDKLSPFEWLGYFSKASLVFTCTYHGMMFGLIFNKKIVFSPRQFIIDKALSLIKYLDMEYVLLEANTVEDKINWEWDYDQINEKMNVMKKQSFEYIEEAIGK